MGNMVCVVWVYVLRVCGIMLWCGVCVCVCVCVWCGVNSMDVYMLKDANLWTNI
jgi:hypothetical protein